MQHCNYNNTGLKIFQAKHTAVLCFCMCLLLSATAQVRKVIPLNNNWYTIATANDGVLPANTYKKRLNKSWKKVSVPHNWDGYEGYRRLLHGNRHGDAWYRKTFTLEQSPEGKRFFLYFEGVGSYATVYVNKKPAGYHAGGRTGFTIDVTSLVYTNGKENVIDVRAYHPSGIKDLPWVCGGCSDERGFSEGSQPFGIFRPVQLIITNNVRVTPFGVHAWSTFNGNDAVLHIDATVQNFSRQSQSLTIIHELLDAANRTVQKISFEQNIASLDSINVQRQQLFIKSPHRWNINDPYRYTIRTTILSEKTVLDAITTSIGFRTIRWRTPSHQFLLNEKPVFINGIAEYEHIMGNSHAFSPEQINADMNWIIQAGFNAFRDGHQPHHLLYGDICERKGLLWWTQLSAHVWYDTDAFRKNLLQLVKEWVIERRNNPAVILWGLQNESKLPEDVAKECTELIRSLDPTASVERLVTTCNGGSGTDWDVPQNWTGTYGGDPDQYANDIKKQILIGEYGAWRTIDLHTEGGFKQDGALSEERMVQLMEKKIRLAESVKDSCAGQFFWLLASHDNPGRVQGGEGLREIDRIGPVNYKGLLTAWHEPTDAFYMYRSNYADGSTDPMVYIASHTWPERWIQPGIKDSIVVYSNCDEVELFNDIDGYSLGKQKRKGKGTHFQWDGVMIQYNILKAVGYVMGKPVASDVIQLHHLPQAPALKKKNVDATNDVIPVVGLQYIYRYNCGGPAYTDVYGNTWQADVPVPDGNTNVAGSVSWAQAYKGMPAAFASQRRVSSPIEGTTASALLQDFRYGKEKLSFQFPVPDGEYYVELYFTEPWLGIGSHAVCGGMRVFDVAINNQVVLKNLDIWTASGSLHALRRTVKVQVKGGMMRIHFPNVTSGQAVISAIAIASASANLRAATSQQYYQDIHAPQYTLQHWADIGQQVYQTSSHQFNALPPVLFGADWFRPQSNLVSGNIQFKGISATTVYLALPAGNTLPDGFADTKEQLIIVNNNEVNRYRVVKKEYAALQPADIYLTGGALLFLHPAIDMQPAYDLKPIVQYRAKQVAQFSGASRQTIQNRECIVATSDAVMKIEWPVQTGVADRYSYTVKYFSPVQQNITGLIRLSDAGGHMMLEEKVTFTFTRSGKWNQFTVNTPAQLNAGNYVLEIIVAGAASLAIQGIDQQ